MTQHTDHLGPIDFAVIEFGGDAISGEVTASLLNLVASGTIRIMDLAVVTKSDVGDIEILEIENVDEAGGLRELAQLVVARVGGTSPGHDEVVFVPDDLLDEAKLDDGEA